MMKKQDKKDRKYEKKAENIKKSKKCENMKQRENVKIGKHETR